MPFKSQAQRRWMYANKPEMAKQWEDETPTGRLPARIHSKSKSKTRLARRAQRRARRAVRRAARK
jgi:hypothetical protein